MLTRAPCCLHSFVLNTVDARDSLVNKRHPRPCCPHRSLARRRSGPLVPLLRRCLLPRSSSRLHPRFLSHFFEGASPTHGLPLPLPLFIGHPIPLLTSIASSHRSPSGRRPTCSLCFDRQPRSNSAPIALPACTYAPWSPLRTRKAAAVAAAAFSGDHAFFLQ